MSINIWYILIIVNVNKNILMNNYNVLVNVYGVFYNNYKQF